jgi:hypothetical protein
LCFLLPSLRNTRNRDETKEVEEALTTKLLSIFLGKVFDMDLLQKYVCGVFEHFFLSVAFLSTSRQGATKTAKTKICKKTCRKLFTKKKAI